jgi:hypothetical protein
MIQGSHQASGSRGLLACSHTSEADSHASELGQPSQNGRPSQIGPSMAIADCRSQLKSSHVFSFRLSYLLGL